MKKILKTIFNNGAKTFFRNKNFANRNEQNNILADILERNSNVDQIKPLQEDILKTLEDPENLYENFSELELNNYASIKKDIEKMMQGEENILTENQLLSFIKAGGTTSAGPGKFLPFTKESLEQNHSKAGKTLVHNYVSSHPECKIFMGQSLALTGGKQEETQSAYISYLLHSYGFPKILNYLKAPSQETNNIKNRDEKIDNLIKETIDSDIRSISGVPSQLLTLFRKVLNQYNKEYIDEIRPNCEVIFGGGTKVSLYKKDLLSLFKKDKKPEIIEVYNASEGFFATENNNQLELLVNHGVFYEFLPKQYYNKDLNKINKNKILTLRKASLSNEELVMIITTQGGLYRYILGDTIRFLHPELNSPNKFPIEITGRLEAYCDVFNEHMIVSYTDQAIEKTLKETGNQLKEYTIAPIFSTINQPGSYECCIEFTNTPINLEKFATIFDTELQKTNDNYKAKRENGSMSSPTIKILHPGTFELFHEKRENLHAQSKVLRLANDRKIIEELVIAIGKDKRNTLPNYQSS
ncbi:MAG TPA: GH3 auxin-responsive promoter family protein [Candidatus Absconditabacterales bacterium]|nr:GH3 auxin-responsive promoter family protein [Candidatus Absconditabacterales bacterium]HMT26956.1 GH3 auxin-responsive promoter family protein [Candidatus Absconditabacterales bacterium]